MSLSTVFGLVLIFLTIRVHLKYKITEFDISRICGELTGIVFVVYFVLLTNRYFDFGIDSVREFWKTVFIGVSLKTYGLHPKNCTSILFNQESKCS